MMDGQTAATTHGTRTLVRTALRIGIAGLVLGPGLGKFITYDASVRFFGTLGLPAPAVLVLVVGAVEIAVAALLLLDRGSRVAAVTAVPVMVVAVATAGPTWQNLGVLVAALLLAGIDTPIRADPRSTSGA